MITDVNPLNFLLDAAKGHPQRAMLLAHRMWEEVPKGKDATLEHWQAAHRSALAELHPEFDSEWRLFDAAEKRTLRAVIAGEGSPYRAAVLERLALTKTMAQKALDRLRATAEVEAEGGKQVVVDPLLAEWIQRLNAGSAEAESPDDL